MSLAIKQERVNFLKRKYVMGTNVQWVQWVHAFLNNSKCLIL